jgi:hypothetical protein
MGNKPSKHPRAETSPSVSGVWFNHGRSKCPNTALAQLENFIHRLAAFLPLEKKTLA